MVWILYTVTEEWKKRQGGGSALLKSWSKMRFMIVKMIVICGLWTWIKLLLKWLDSHFFLALLFLLLSLLHVFPHTPYSLPLFPLVQLIVSRLFLCPPCFLFYLYPKSQGNTTILFDMRSHWSAQRKLYFFLLHGIIVFGLLTFYCYASFFHPVFLLSFSIFAASPLLATLFPHAFRPYFLPAHLQCLAVLWLAC